MIIFVYFFLSLLYISIILFFIYTIFAIINGAPYVPTAKKNIGDMLRLINLKKNDLLVDLGSGDGRILFQAAKTGCKCIGIEINPTLYWWSKIMAKLKGYNNIFILRDDLWNFDLKNVDVLTLFFIPSKMEKLMIKIKNEMRPGSRVVSNMFKFPNWQYTENSGKMYLYIV